MPLPNRLSLAAAALLALSLASTAFAAPPHEGLVGELDALRRQSVAVGRAAQQHEMAIAALRREVTLLERDAAGTQRGLDDTRREQAELLAALERLARRPPEALALAPEGPIDRLRSGILMAAAVPALTAEAQALTREIDRLAAVRVQLGVKQDELAMRRATLVKNHEVLAQMAVRRGELTRQLVRDDPEFEARLRLAGEQAADLKDLIRRCDAEIERRDKGPTDRSARKATPGGVDPTRPKMLRTLDAAQPALTTPVASGIAQRFAQADAAGPAHDGIGFAATPGAVVLAPFDGRVAYAAAFRDFGLVLIIRHGGGYHSVLAGLGQIDVKPGRWVLAGEPLGTMSDVRAGDPGGGLQFELRRDGRPVDPLPLLAQRGERSDNGTRAGDNRVRE